MWLFGWNSDAPTNKIENESSSQAKDNPSDDHLEDPLSNNHNSVQPIKTTEVYKKQSEDKKLELETNNIPSDDERIVDDKADTETVKQVKDNKHNHTEITDHNKREDVDVFHDVEEVANQVDMSSLKRENEKLLEALQEKEVIALKLKDENEKLKLELEEKDAEITLLRNNVINNERILKLRDKKSEDLVSRLEKLHDLVQESEDYSYMSRDKSYLSRQSYLSKDQSYLSRQSYLANTVNDICTDALFI